MKNKNKEINQSDHIISSEKKILTQKDLSASTMNLTNFKTKLIYNKVACNLPSTTQASTSSSPFSQLTIHIKIQYLKISRVSKQKKSIGDMKRKTISLLNPYIFLNLKNFSPLRCYMNIKMQHKNHRHHQEYKKGQLKITIRKLSN